MQKPLTYHPTVCPVGNHYQIMIVTEREALLSVQVGEKTYYYHQNGIRLSSPGGHQFTIPMSVLDTAGAYTVIVENMIARQPYFSTTEPAYELQYAFHPLTKQENIHIYHLADVHGKWEKAVGAALYAQKLKNLNSLDLLIVNGDISSTSETFEDMTLVYKIASHITEGTFPCLISSGNHDLRGIGAQKLSSYMPGENGKSYYSFRIGCIWGLLVDAGEDKPDTHEAYGGTIFCHAFRMEQDSYIENIIQNASSEYDKEDVKYKFIVSHIPFPFKREAPFDIEKELYTRWGKLLKDHIQPDLMLCGHTHDFAISAIGSDLDELGQPCPIIVGSDVKNNEDNEIILAGAYIHLSEHQAEIIFNTNKEIIYSDMITI